MWLDLLDGFRSYVGLNLGGAFHPDLCNWCRRLWIRTYGRMWNFMDRADRQTDTHRRAYRNTLQP